MSKCKPAFDHIVDPVYGCMGEKPIRLLATTIWCPQHPECIGHLVMHEFQHCIHFRCSSCDLYAGRTEKLKEVNLQQCFGDTVSR